MPSSPEIQVAVAGISRVLVQVHSKTAPISSGERPDFVIACSAACSASSLSERAVYCRCSTPVLSLISSALIGDQLYALLRTTSSFVTVCSPFTTARASSRGWIRNSRRTSTAGNGETGRGGSGTFRNGGLVIRPGLTPWGERGNSQSRGEDSTT